MNVRTAFEFAARHAQPDRDALHVAGTHLDARLVDLFLETDRE